jgi:acyl-CoA synthetase (NDP forming)
MTAMDKPVARISMHDILHPSSVAVFGASESKDKFGGRIMNFLVRHGFSGKIFPINPNRSEILGRKAYPRITDIHEPVQVAMLAVPPDRLRDSIEQCIQAGVGCCIIITTGFAEAGEAGALLQNEIVDRARAAGMRIMGPNCMGLINTHWKLALCSSVVLDTDRFLTGRIGLVSQSGALMVSLFDRAESEGIGLGICVSLGNQSDIEICDVLEYLIDDPGTSAICLYVEGFRDPARFMRATAAGRKAGKPLILVKTGRTPDGVRAAQSHTASLAGSFEVLAAVCREHGVVIVEDPVTMVRVADLLVRWPKAEPGGIGIISGSGGGAGLMVDRLSQAGMRLARLSDDTRAKLGEMLLPPQADNPVDLGGRLLPESVEISDKAMTVLANDADVSIIVLYLASMPFFEQRTRLLGQAGMASGKPIVVVGLPGTAADRPRAALRDVDCPYFDSVEDMLAALRGFLDHRELAKTVATPPSRPQSVPAVLPKNANSLAQFAERYGVPLVSERTCESTDDAVAAAQEIGFPVVLKGNVEGVTHKSDLGLVRTGLGTEKQLREAWEAIEKAAVAHAGSAKFAGCLVQEQIPPGLELICSIRRDPHFGALVLVGAGGVTVELTRDTISAPAPVSPARAEELLRSLRLAPLFDGYRGRDRIDVSAVAKVVSDLSWLAFDLGERLVDLEINPLIVGRAGIKAVDLRGAVHPANQSDASTLQ